MKPNTKKFSLFLEHNNNDGVIEWKIEPMPVQTLVNDNVIEYQYDLDFKKTNTIKILVTTRTGSNSFVRVQKMLYGNVLLENINSYSIFKTPNGAVKPHGYLDQIGEFYIKLRGNPVTLNYLAYLASLTRENKTC